MFIKQIYTDSISEAAYYIESNGEAVVVDPLRDIEVYLTLAADRKAVIKYIFETHFNADFVSGQLDLSKKTGAVIVYGPKIVTGFPVHIAGDGEIFTIGNISIKALHTPGHTIESTCYFMTDETGTDHAIFTGNTLFAGNAGRPGLSSGDMSKEELAGILYDSIREKILPLADDILVYPTQDAGSSRAENLAPDIYSTIGEEKKNNYALQLQSRETFIAAVTNGLDDAPGYFAVNARINKEGYDSLDAIKSNGLTPLSVAGFKSKIKKDVVIADTRNADIFTEGFIPGSIFIGLEGRFAEWAGSLLPFDKPIILVTEKGKEEETVVRLARVGFSKIEGYLKGSFEAWKNAGERSDMIINIEADELAMDIPYDPNLQVVDVRKEIEFADGHVKNALNMSLADMTDIALIAGFEENQQLYIHCASGYRSVIACSLLKKQGFHNLRNITGGWSKIKEESRIKTEKDVSALN